MSTALDTLSFSYGGRAPLDSVAEFLLLGTPPSDGLTARIIAAAGTGARVTITPLSDDDAIREAASTLARRLVRKKLAARVGSPEGGRLEGLRIEIVRRDAPHR